jgi:hypothetical protein
VYVDDVFLGEGSSTEALLTLVPGVHRVAVVATDDSGNSATSSALSLTYVKEPVVISEIAWPGTEVSPNNQWIELYNNTDKPINLSSMKLVSETSAFAVPLSSTIAPHSYYLLERSMDDVVPGVVADMVYGSDTGLSPLGEVLVLIYTMGEREVAIDSTPNVSTCEGWCEGSDASFSTMVRLNTLGEGKGTANWANDGHYMRSIFEATGITVRGSPKASIENPCLLSGLAAFHFTRLATIMIDPCL